MKKFWNSAACAVLLCGCSSVGDAPDDHRTYSDSVARSYATAVHKNSLSRVAADSAGAGKSSFFQQNNSRMMAYTSGFTLTVKKRDAALDEVKKLAESLGGYLVSSARGNMKLKVPVTKADEFLKLSGNHGKMSDFRISAEDLTDTITDLGVRLDNLRKLRTRLTELLSKTKSVDEMLKVERELNRITTEIERIDAQLQNNKKRVAFVTFDVAVIEEHGAVPGGTPQAVSYFAFFKNFAAAQGGKEDEPLFNTLLPENFVAVTREYNPADGFTATTSDDCVLRTWNAELPDNTTLKFWQDMSVRALSSLHKFSDIKCFQVKFNGEDAVKITAQRTTSNGIQSYLAIISIDHGILCSDKLQIVEFFGPESAFKKYASSVSKALLPAADAR